MPNWLRDRFARHSVDLVFHDCGSLPTDMVQLFAAELRPAMLSLGSSRKLWEDAAVVSKDIVLFGNLPTRTCYSDPAMLIEEVKRQTCETVRQMAACGHPHILGSECDDVARTGRRGNHQAQIERHADQRMLSGWSRLPHVGGHHARASSHAVDHRNA